MCVKLQGLEKNPININMVAYKEEKNLNNCVTNTEVVRKASPLCGQPLTISSSVGNTVY